MRPICSSIRACSPIRRRSIRSSAAALLATLSIAACAGPPASPTIVASPGPGKTFPQFLQDDDRCRQYSAAADKGVTPQQSAASSAIGSAATGTVLGAAAGALIGVAAGSAGVGAAIGAGSGLLLGSAIGAGHVAQASAGSPQSVYNRVYAQCMAAAGEGVIPPQPLAAVPDGYGPTAAYGYGSR